MRLSPVLLVLGGCGRIAFDELSADAPGPDAHTLCVAETFEDGAGDWQSVIGAFATSANAGPDGSTVLRTGIGSKENLLTHPALAGVDAVRVEADFAIDNATTGDFNIYFLTGTLEPRGDSYEVGLYPTTGDNPPDEVAHIVNGTLTPLVQHAPVLDAISWHHVLALRRTDGSIHVELDGVSYMESPADTTLAPPFTVAFRIFNEGQIDNVNVDCAPSASR